MGKGFGMDSGCRHKTVMSFGIIQIIMGLIIFISGIFVILKNSWVESTYHGIWGGIFIIITGALGLAGGIKKSKGLEIGFMVMSILSAVIIWLCILILSAVGMIGDSIYSKEELVKDYTSEDIAECFSHALENADKKEHAGFIKCPNKPAAVSNLVIAVMAGLLFLMAILSASFACCAVCKCCGGGSDNDVQDVSYNQQQQVQHGYA